MAARRSWFWRCGQIHRSKHYNAAWLTHRHTQKGYTSAIQLVHIAAVLLANVVHWVSDGGCLIWVATAASISVLPSTLSNYFVSACRHVGSLSCRCCSAGSTITHSWCVIRPLSCGRALARRAAQPTQQPGSASTQQGTVTTQAVPVKQFVTGCA
jgi:hypothetical protein